MMRLAFAFAFTFTFTFAACVPATPAAPSDAGTTAVPPAQGQAQKIGHIDAKDRPADGGCDVWRVDGSIFAVCDARPGTAAKK